MTPTSTQPADTRIVSQHASSARPSSRSRPTRLLLALALLVLALLGIALAAVTFSSNSTPSASSSASSEIARGLRAESAGQNQQAVNDFTAATTADPGNAIGYYDLGVVYQENLNSTTSAISAYNKALSAKPNYKPALFNLAILETSSDPGTAISLYNRLLALNPNDANSLFNLGLVLIAQNQTAQGHADLKKAIFIDSALSKRVPAGITP
jgi:tetratricopeptide (TPR) repeat protein